MERLKKYRGHLMAAQQRRPTNTVGQSCCSAQIPSQVNGCSFCEPAPGFASESTAFVASSLRLDLFGAQHRRYICFPSHSGFEHLQRGSPRSPEGSASLQRGSQRSQEG
jgi:hypothetical protein